MEFQDYNLNILTKDEIKNCRHKSEKRLYYILLIINLLIVFGVITLCIINFNNYYEIINNTNTTINGAIASHDISVLSGLSINRLPFELKLLILGVSSLIAFPFIINLMYAKYRSMAIKVTEKNFPEIYEMVKNYSSKLNFKKIPETYIVQANGVLNAFSAFIIRKQYIEINADLLEIAYREHQDMKSIGFVIAHELSHIKYKHATLGYNLSIFYSSALPILGPTASRAREYSCDRLAQKITGDNGIDAMLSLSAGKHLYKQIDINDYIESAKNIKGLFVWCNNLVSSHPILPKRIKALADGEGSGDLY